ncbi:uncharacterized protein LOC135461777 [Liolophura sinensis]|uniref:uncharacterized protein LOC135461777 n=1 Tax=Liolophura sinensis TaxID=3198878 RepID=UPI003158677C
MKDKDPKLDLSLVPFVNSLRRSRSWIRMEMMPMCCALCTSARSLMEVYRRQMAICTTEIKQLKLDVVCLRKALDLKENQIAIHKRRELKHQKTEETIEEVIVQVSCLKNDINNLLLQNSLLENERDQLQAELQNCRKDLAECQKKFSTAETQLDDVLFSLSLKGYGSLIDFTGNEINLLKIDGKPMDLDGWQLYKNKRCGRLLAMINHQGKTIKKLRTSLAEKEENENRLQADVDNKQQLLEMAKTQVGSLMDEVIELKGSLSSSVKREEGHLRLLANIEVERSQAKYEAETREHHLFTQIQELKDALAKKPENSVMASTHRLVSSGLAIVSDVCRPSWCASLCPTVGKQQHTTTSTIPQPPGDQPKIRSDSICWENEEPVAKQPRVSSSKKATKRSHKQLELGEKPQAKGVHHRKRTNFPANCPVCGISFSSAIDNRVIDEHLAFHDVYRV